MARALPLQPFLLALLLWPAVALSTASLATPPESSASASADSPGRQTCPEWAGLPDYDVRRGSAGIRRPLAGQPRRPSQTFGQPACSKPPPPVRPDPGVCRGGPHVRVDRHEFFGTPAYVGSTVRFLTERRDPAEVDAIAVVSEYVARHCDVFGFDAAELSDTRLSRDFVTRHNGVRHLTFQQQHEGIDVFGAVLRTSVTRHGQIISIGSTMLARPTNGFEAPAFALSPIEAVRAAAASVAITMSADPQPTTIVFETPARAEARGPVGFRTHP